MTKNTERIEEILRFDALSAAEALTGKNYKDDEFTSMLGMMLQIKNSAAKTELLQKEEDTCYANSLQQNLQVIENEGFQLCASGKFLSSSGDDSKEEEWRIYWRGGILVFLDSFRGNLNHGNAYFNLLFHEKPPFGSTIFSGYWKRTEEGKLIACGHIDIREGFRHRLSAFENEGQFLSKWDETPFLWLLHHMDTKIDGYDYEAINQQRIALLPTEVQQSITPGTDK